MRRGATLLGSSDYRTVQQRQKVVWDSTGLEGWRFGQMSAEDTSSEPVGVTVQGQSEKEVFCVLSLSCEGSLPVRGAGTRQVLVFNTGER